MSCLYLHMGIRPQVNHMFGLWLFLSFQSHFATTVEIKAKHLALTLTCRVLILAIIFPFSSNFSLLINLDFFLSFSLMDSSVHTRLVFACILVQFSRDSGCILHKCQFFICTPLLITIVILGRNPDSTSAALCFIYHIFWVLSEMIV